MRGKKTANPRTNRPIPIQVKNTNIGVSIYRSADVSVNPYFRLTDQELQLKVIFLGQRAVEGHPDDELLTTSDHQALGVVGRGVVVWFVDLLTHVDALH